MWKNKHVVVAMLVAPVLAIMAWFAIDYFVAERPHAAKEGAAYKLIAQSNCRYDSGQCDLENSEFKLSIRPEMLAATSMSLTMTSSHALESAAMGVIDGNDGMPQQMTLTDDTGTTWQALLPRPASDEATIRLAVTAQGATWYAEVPVIFLEAGL